jgi:hypothetical protein
MYVVGHEGLGFHDTSSFQSFIVGAVLRAPLFLVQYHIIYYFFCLALIYSPLGGEARINIKYDITQAWSKQLI